MTKSEKDDENRKSHSRCGNYIKTFFFSFRGFFELEMKSKAPSRVAWGGEKWVSVRTKDGELRIQKVFQCPARNFFFFLFLSSMKTFQLTSEFPSLSSELPFDGVVVEFLFLLAIFLFLSLYTSTVLHFLSSPSSSAATTTTQNSLSRTENEEIG